MLALWKKASLSNKMKITTQKLKQIILEEIGAALTKENSHLFESASVPAGPDYDVIEEMVILDAEYEDGTPVEEGFAFYEVLDDIDEGKKKKSQKDKMACNRPRRIRKGEPGAGKKKFVVKACDGGQEKIIRYGDAKLKIKKSNPKRRKSFRARHNCKTPGSKLKARYWSCKKW